MIPSLLSIPTRLYAWAAADLTLDQANPWALTALEVARGELGHGEEGGNNLGPHLRRYRGELGGRGAWCAAFVYHCLAVAWAGLEGDRECPVKRTHGARALFRRVGRAGQVLDRPVVGAVACWARGPRGSWMGHVGIVSRVEGERWWVIEGNIGPYPARVTEREVTGRKRLIGWAAVPSVGR